MIPVVIIFSFLLDGIFSMFVGIDSYFNSVFSLMSLIIVYPYFNKKNNSYFKLCFLVGLFYDLVYTDTIVFNAFIFLLLGLIIVKLNEILGNNPVNNSLMAIIIIIVFRLVTYFFLILTENIAISKSLLFESIYTSLVSNIIYIILIFIITDKISKKLKIRKTT